MLSQGLRMPYRIICDFDGSIAQQDVTDCLLEAFALPEWREWEAEWQAGRVGSRECMWHQVDLLRVLHEELDRHLDQMAIDPTFVDFVAHANRLGCTLLVVSDGIDYAIRRILSRYGLGFLPVIANHLECLERDRYQLSFPYHHSECRSGAGTCKCHMARGDDPHRPQSLLIGDGVSDFCAATAVDVVFAKDKLLVYCREQGLPYYAFTNFAEALQLLNTLVQQAMDVGSFLELT